MDLWAVQNAPADRRIDPAPRGEGKTCSPDWIRSHTDRLLATDSFTAQVWTGFGPVAGYARFVIHVGSRKGYIAAMTTRHPTDAWVRQAVADGVSAAC